MAIVDSSNQPTKDDIKKASTPTQPDPQLETPVGGFTSAAGARDTNAMEDALHTAQGQSYEYTNNQFQNNQQFDWLTFNLTGYHVNTSPASVSLTQTLKAIQEYWDENLSPDLEIDIIPIDKENTHNLPVSLLVFVVRDSRREDSPVAHHTLLLEGSCEGIPSRIDQVNGRQVEVMQLVSDTYDKNMRQIIHSTVRRHYPKASVVLTADAEVVNRHFDLTDERNIRNLTINAVLAGRTQMALANENFNDINLARARHDTANLVQVNTFSHENEIDLSSNPVRADITMTMSAQPVQRDNMNIQNSSVITMATGYIDLLYQDTGTAPGAMPWGQQPPGYAGYGPVPTPKLQANLVLTQLTNTKIQTLPGILQAVANASFIRENNAFLTALMPKPTQGNKKNMHDIGNIGFDIAIDPSKPDVFEKFSTNPAEFDLNAMMALYRQFFHPGLAISLDVPECGSQTWAYQTLAAAAYGHEKAKKHLFDAFNILTNGNFERHYRELGGKNILVFSHNNRILLGTYDSPEGKRDIRDLDYLAICGLVGKKDRSEISDFTDTYNSSHDWRDRLRVRQTMIQSYLKNPQFTGFANRISFEGVALQALMLGCYDCGYRVTPQSPYLSDMSYQRANAGYIASAVLDATNSGVFTANTGYQGGAGYNGGRFGVL